MKRIKEIWKTLFNTNTGYYLKEVYYLYEGKPHIGYVICKGFLFFGAFGYDNVAICVDMDEVNKTLKRLNITLTGKHVS